MTVNNSLWNHIQTNGLTSFPKVLLLGLVSLLSFFFTRIRCPRVFFVDQCRRRYRVQPGLHSIASDNQMQSYIKSGSRGPGYILFHYYGWFKTLCHSPLEEFQVDEDEYSLSIFNTLSSISIFLELTFNVPYHNSTFWQSAREFLASMVRGPSIVKRLHTVAVTGRIDVL
jgi:hypothetical protein